MTHFQSSHGIQSPMEMKLEGNETFIVLNYIIGFISS